MKKALLSYLILSISFTFFAWPAFALNPYEWNTKEEDPRSYKQVKVRFNKDLEVYDYPSVFLSLQRELEESPVWTRNEPAYRSLHKAMQILNERFSHFESELSVAGSEMKPLSEFLDQYGTGLFQFPCPDGVCFREDYTVSYMDLEILADSQAEDFLYRIYTANRLLTDFKKPALTVTAKAIKDAKERWEILMREGMSQYPWEAAFNGWVIGGGTIQFPPSRQWVLVHPELGVEISTDGIKDLRAKEVMAIELAGHVWYRWRDIDKPAKGLNWWGVSAAASLRDDIRPGIGFMAHYGRFLTLGLTWHDDDNDSKWFDGAPYVIMGIDLFRFAEDRVPRYQKKIEEALEIREGYFK